MKITNWTLFRFIQVTLMQCIFNNIKTCLWLEGKVSVTNWPTRKTIGGDIRRYREVGAKTRDAIILLKRWKHTLKSQKGCRTVGNLS